MHLESLCATYSLPMTSISWAAAVWTSRPYQQTCRQSNSIDWKHRKRQDHDQQHEHPCRYSRDQPEVRAGDQFQVPGSNPVQGWHLLSRSPHQDYLRSGSHGQTKQDLTVLKYQLCKQVQALQVSRHLQPPPWQLSRDGNWRGSGMSHATTASPKPSIARLAEVMLGGQHQRVDILAHARAAHKGLLQKRQELRKRTYRCWIIPHVLLTIHSVKGLNWTLKNSAIIYSEYVYPFLLLQIFDNYMLSSFKVFSSILDVLLIHSSHIIPNAVWMHGCLCWEHGVESEVGVCHVYYV